MCGKIVINLAIADHQLVVYLAFAQAGGNDFTADFLAEFLEIDAILGQPGAKFCQCREFVFLRDALHRLVQLRVVNMHPGFLGELRLQHVDNHAFQYLFFQRIRCG